MNQALKLERKVTDNPIQWLRETLEDGLVALQQDIGVHEQRIAAMQTELERRQMAVKAAEASIVKLRRVLDSLPAE